jgi:hypothetical protein
MIIFFRAAGFGISLLFQVKKMQSALCVVYTWYIYGHKKKLLCKREHNLRDIPRNRTVRGPTINKQAWVI